MTGKERMLAAMWLEEPDTVPVSPDVSNMIPAKLLGKPLYDIYVFDDPPLWEGYLEAVRAFKFDAWFIYASLGEGALPSQVGALKAERRLVSRGRDAIVFRDVIRTPKGDFYQTVISPADQPPWLRDGFIKRIPEDLAALGYLLADPLELDPAPFRRLYRKVGDLGVVAGNVCLPFDWWYSMRGGIKRALLDLFYRPDVVKEAFKRYADYAARLAEALIRVGADEILLQGSCSSISILSPRQFKEYNLPLIRDVVRVANGRVPVHLHVCGRSRAIVDLVANTGLNVVEPLERPPGGDVDLAEVKRRFGDRLCLKGNVNTFGTMLSSPEDVEGEVRWCIAAAAYGGGFILSTGDQVPRDTPTENLVRFVKAGRAYGRYNLGP